MKTPLASVALTAKGTVKLCLPGVAWHEALLTLNAWSALVNLYTSKNTPLVKQNLKWWSRLALIIGLLGQGGQLELVAAQTATGVAPDEVKVRLTKLEAVTLLEVWWALGTPQQGDQDLCPLFTKVLGELHELLN